MLVGWFTVLQGPVVLCKLLLIYKKLGRSWYIGAPADKVEFGGNV